MLPLQQVRYCCQHLKERTGAGTVTVIGVRKQESLRRAKRNEVEISGHKFSGTLDQFNIYQQSVITCVSGKDKILLSPIFEWSTKQIWDFIKLRNLPYCSLYDEGFHRIGCVCCPMASAKRKQIERKRYPSIEKAIKKSIKKLIEQNNYGSNYNLNEDEIFEWWISNQNLKKWIADNKTQLKLNFEQ